MKNCLCIICFRPHHIWLEFLNSFIKYDVYLVIDCDIDYSKINKIYPNINFIQIPSEACAAAGFTDMNFVIRKKIAGWEKAMYYFSTINTSYDNVWALEEDVFFHSEQTLIDIDTKYPICDMLSQEYFANPLGKNSDWLWHRITIMTPPPYYACMCCGLRISRKLLEKIKEYASTYKTLYFLEAMFPTICKTNGLTIDTPLELRNVVYRRDYTISDINRNSLYHPVKDFKQHADFRRALNAASETITHT